MKRTSMWAVGGLALCLVGVAADRGRTAEGTMPDEAEMMRRWQECATPGAEHEHLAKGAGKWNVALKMWMAGPEGPVTESSGTAESKMILGGRFLYEEVKTEMMGQPVEMVTIAGYDNFKKKHTFAHLDSMGTVIIRAEGIRAPGSNIVVYYGTMDEPMLDMHDLPVKYVETMVDDDHGRFEIYDLAQSPDGVKVIEINYERAE